MLKKIFSLILFLPPVFICADEGMAKYLIDGRFVIYAVSVEEVSRTARALFTKFQGPAEGAKSLGVWQNALRGRMGVNVLDPAEAQTIGIDPRGSVSYVHLGEGKGYLIFTIRNKDQLTYTLDKLPKPPSYRILEDRYALFSITPEILDYTNFQGLPASPEFQTIAKALSFNWMQNFVWVTGAYLREKSTVNPGQYVFPDGDRVGIVFNVDNEKATMDAYTVYKDPAVKDALKKSMVPLREQRLSLLDFESGTPAVVGQFYLHLPSYIDSMMLIDRTEEFGLRRLFASLEKADINLKGRLFPYLRGRVSYVVRAYDPLRKNINATFVAGISDETRVREFLTMLVASVNKAGRKTMHKSLFTRDFYGIPIGAYTLWLGIVEGNLLASTSEPDLNLLVNNVYEGSGGFLQKFPAAFARGVRGRVYGGLNHVYVPQFIQEVNIPGLPWLRGLALPFEIIEWNYYLQEVDGQPGRRDTITGRFW